jgi:hypothetical protein
MTAGLNAGAWALVCEELVCKECCSVFESDEEEEDLESDGEDGEDDEDDEEEENEHGDGKKEEEGQE